MAVAPGPGNLPDRHDGGGFSYGLPLRRLMHLYRQARAAQDGMYKQFRLLTDGSN